MCQFSVEKKTDFLLIQDQQFNKLVPAEIQACLKYVGILIPSKSMAVGCLAMQCISNDKVCICFGSSSFFVLPNPHTQSHTHIHMLLSDTHTHIHYAPLILLLWLFQLPVNLRDALSEYLKAKHCLQLWIYSDFLIPLKPHFLSSMLAVILSLLYHRKYKKSNWTDSLKCLKAYSFLRY